MNRDTQSAWAYRQAKAQIFKSGVACCGTCGHRVKKGYTFCNHCGQRQKEVVQNVSEYE